MHESVQRPIVRKNFKMLVRFGKIYILKYDIGLFESGWNSIAAFNEDCKSECARIVALLNECDRKTNKDNDEERDS